MPRVRKIPKSPESTNFYLVDANFLANRFIPEKVAPNAGERERIKRCAAWWAEIDRQLAAGQAVVYVPDVCIAEAFKVLAKKYYQQHWFKTPRQHKTARDRLSKFIQTPSKELKAAGRQVRIHDVSTSRDIIISIDRFFETFFKKNLNVSVPDLIVLATAKYLLDFFRVPARSLYIVTLDGPLWKGSKKIPDVPTAFNPTVKSDPCCKKVVGLSPGSRFWVSCWPPCASR